ncbi:MAG TPA: hypothetical protein DHV12_03130 [Thermotogae bacterium]|nr:hypothetical protein [Thermotogota bacterium]
MLDFSIANIIDFLFPRFCPVCGKKVEYREVICESCLNAFEGPLTGTFSFRPPLDGVYHFWWYEDVVERVIKIYKYSDRPSLARVLAIWIDRTLRYYSLNLPITYVATTPGAFKERGFDTMKMIGDKLKKMGYTVLETLTAKDVPSQAGLNRSERLKNVRGKFQLLKHVKLPRELIIMDDVYTTGATLEECARLLKSCGVRRVIGVTVARTGAPES